MGRTPHSRAGSAHLTSSRPRPGRPRSRMGSSRASSRRIRRRVASSTDISSTPGGGQPGVARHRLHGHCPGKTLASISPSSTPLARSPSSRIDLYPTKALAQDQGGALTATGSRQYDRRSTTGPPTSAADRSGNGPAILCQPIHAPPRVLPHHDRWVIACKLRSSGDEAHAYRGVSVPTSQRSPRLRRLAASTSPIPSPARKATTRPPETGSLVVGVEATGRPGRRMRAGRTVALWHPRLLD